jgi:3-deoxy-D-arabino-heptulosonate 7-phosphate (DAHP) synthase
MIEMHPDPRNAAVDPLQAINLEEFTKLINQLRIISETFKKTIV